MLLLFLGFEARGQEVVTVSGVVTDEEHQPLVGASILQEGTLNGTTASMEGKFSISVPENAVLVVYYIGYETQRVHVRGKRHIDVVLKEDMRLLDDVTVIGYGTGSRIGTVIGSVAKIDGAKIENIPNSNIADVLQGKVAGLSVITSSGEPSEGSSIRLHGSGSISAGTEPLVVLNGVPVSGTVYNSISASDIESINVLKDASATSIYGSRAANGVIFITTKRGQRGSGVSVTARAQYGISQPATGKYEVLSASEDAKYQLDNGIIDQQRYDDIIASGVNTNWRDYYYRSSAPTYQFDLSVAGGTDKATYYLAGSYLSKDGTAPGSSLERYTFNSNIDIYAREWLKVGANLVLGFDKSSYAHSLGNSVFNAAFMSLLSLPYESPFDENGAEKEKITGFDNPNYMIRTHPNSNSKLTVFGNAYIRITPVKNLNIKSQFGTDAYASWSEDNVLPSYSGALNNGTVSRWHGNAGTFTITNTIDYNFDFDNRAHRLYLLAGQEGIKSDELAFSAMRSGQIHDKLLMLSSGSGTPSVGDDKTSYVFNSWFGRAEYGYADKYIFDASLRNDRSSRFGRKNRASMFYSFGAKWDIGKESFLRGNRVVSDLNFKVSYGTQGNAAISNYAHLSHLSTTNYKDLVGFYNASEGNEDLGWETQRLLTVAAEARLWDRLAIGLEFYNRKTDDLLMDVPIPATTGYLTEPRNIAAMLNRGVDVSFDADIFRNKDWYVGFNATFNYNHNEVTSLFNGLTEYALSGRMVCYAIGHDANEFYLQKFIGVNPDTGAPQWYSETAPDNVTEDFNSATMQFVGKSFIAPYTGGFGVNARWRGIGFSADFSWNYGKYMINNALFFLENSQYDETFNRSKRVLRRWQKPGDVTDMPRFGEDTQFDTSILENASFLRLKSLNIFYDFPEKLIGKGGILHGMRIYFSGRNLLTATKYSGYDPEVDGNISLGNYPNSREFVGGIQLTF